MSEIQESSYTYQMMRRLLCQIVMFSVLFMSLDGAADIPSVGHPHGDDPTYQLDSQRFTAAVVTNSTADQNAEHCEHCCHGHVVSIAEQEASVTPPATLPERKAAPAIHFRNLTQAPPTPPPTA